MNSLEHKSIWQRSETARCSDFSELLETVESEIISCWYCRVCEFRKSDMYSSSSFVGSREKAIKIARRTRFVEPFSKRRSANCSEKWINDGLFSRVNACVATVEVLRCRQLTSMTGWSKTCSNVCGRDLSTCRYMDRRWLLPSRRVTSPSRSRWTRMGGPKRWESRWCPKCAQ